MVEQHEDKLAAAWEKTGVERFVEFALERLHGDLRTLSREWRQLTELEYNQKIEAIEGVVMYLQKSVLYVLLKRRGELSPSEFLQTITEIHPPEETFDGWRDFVLTHIQTVYDALDAMNMLLTGEAYKDMWGERIYAGALRGSSMLAYGRANKRMHDKYPPEDEDAGPKDTAVEED